MQIQNQLWGYARVSTTGQNANFSLQTQVEKLMSAGVLEHNIVTETGSGKNFDRPLLLQLVREKVKHGDTLVVVALDRLGRSMIGNFLFINEMHQKGILFRALNVPEIDWDNNLDVLITCLFSFVGAQELALREERTKRGIQKAKERGLYRGRKLKSTPKLLEQILNYQKKGLKNTEIMELLHVGRSTFYKTLQLVDKKNGSNQLTS